MLVFQLLDLTTLGDVCLYSILYLLSGDCALEGRTLLNKGCADMLLEVLVLVFVQPVLG